MSLQLVGLCVFGYLLGSVPFGLLIGEIFYGRDVRRSGSGNIGFANVTRTFGWAAGVGALVGDVGKGLIPVLLARQTFGEGWQPILVGFFAILGAVFSLFLLFKGGKGVGTSAGVFAGLAPIPFLWAIGGYLLMLGIFRYSSLGSLTGAVIIPVALILQKAFPGGADPYIGTVIVSIGASLLIIWLHRENIRRIANGTERNLSHRK